jgi:hypothetical protein
VRQTKQARWTEAETAIMRALYATADRDRLRAALPGRSWDSIASRAAVLGLRRRYERRNGWTEAEDAVLRQLYPTAEWDEIEAALPGRTRKAIALHAHQLRLRRQRRGCPNGTPWTAGEDAVLRQLYPTAEWDRLLRELPTRSPLAIRHRAWVLGLRRAVQVAAVYVYRGMRYRVRTALGQQVCIEQEATGRQFWIRASRLKGIAWKRVE